MIPANTVWVLVVVIVAVYLVARWVRSKTATEDEQNEPVRYLIRAAGTGAAEHLGVSAGTLAAKSGLVVTRCYFGQIDIETGPPDPADFYDELFVDLRDPESGQSWQNSIHVATPRALDRVMLEEHWDSVIGTELLIVRRYDRDSILHGAIDHLQEIYEARIQLMGKEQPRI